MKRFLSLASLVAAVGCTSYRQTFRYQAPRKDLRMTSGDRVTNAAGRQLTWHEVRISFWTILAWGKASRLKTETQTEEFMHSIDGTGVQYGVETNAVKAIAEGVTEAVIKTIAPVP